MTVHRSGKVVIPTIDLDQPVERQQVEEPRFPTPDLTERPTAPAPPPMPELQPPTRQPLQLPTGVDPSSAVNRPVGTPYLQGIPRTGRG